MYRKNTAGQFVSFAAVNATTGAALTGATVSMRRCLDGTFAAGGATITEDTGLGFYKVALAQADTNGNNCQFFFTATNMVPICINIVTTAADPTDTVRFGMTALPNVASGSAGAIITSGTGTAQLSVASGLVTLAGVTHTGAVIPTVTTVTNQLTAAQIATGVWQDTTAGDFTVASSIGKSLYTTGNAPGAASGLAIVGSNMGTVSSVTGNVGGNVVGSVGSVTGAVGSVTAAVAITSNIKKNQALSAFQFMMTDSTNHAPATGKTVTVTRSIDGAAFAAGTLSAVTEVSNGMYKVDFGAGDLNGNVIILRATATGCDDTFERILVQP